MAIKKLRPVTPGQRYRVAPAFTEITKSTPEKSLVVTKKRSGGRNNTGKMTMRYLGGGHKKKSRIIDFKRNKFDIPATVKSIEYDPTRSARIALLYYADGAVKLPSGETRKVLVTCLATIGSVSNSDHMNVNLGKAGRNRWLGRRPRVRGVAMNPVDHPMGGGEGKSSGGHPRSRTGLYAKGKKTRAPKKYSNNLIISRGKKKK